MAARRVKQGTAISSDIRMSSLSPFAIGLQGFVYGIFSKAYANCARSLVKAAWQQLLSIPVMLL
jgi:hypothetical protein